MADLPAEVVELLEELKRLKAGVPFHQHRCGEGHAWFCSSPYCEGRALDVDCVEHGGPGPKGPPNA